MQLSVDEKRAVEAASEAAGSFLDRIGKTDLATMTEREWLEFIGHAYGCVVHQLRTIWGNEAPF